jgi:MFS family permease
MFVFYAMFVLCGASFLAPMMAITHKLMPLHMRALSSALLFLIMNLIGNGAGPFVVGVLNDLLAPRFGDEAVRYSLTLVISGAIAGLGCTLYAARRLPADLNAQSEALT